MVPACAAWAMEAEVIESQKMSGRVKPRSEIGPLDLFQPADAAVVPEGSGMCSATLASV